MDKADEAAGWGEGEETRRGYRRRTRDTVAMQSGCHRRETQAPTSASQGVPAWVAAVAAGRGTMALVHRSPSDTGFGDWKGSQVSCSAVSNMARAVVTGRSQVSMWALAVSKKGMQLVAEGPHVPVPDTGSTAHNEAFNETLGSPARLPPARCLWGLRDSRAMLADYSISALWGCASAGPRVYRIRVKRLSTDTDSFVERVLLKTFQNRRVSSPAPVTMASPSGDIAK